MATQSAAITPRFFMYTQTNDPASEAAGRAVFTDYEAVELKFAADKNKTLVFPAHEAEPNATREAGETVTYAQVYAKQYQQFKDGLAQEASGTPLEAGKFLTQAKRRELKALHVNSIEALAALDGHPLKQLGPGGRELKNLAQAHLDQAAASGDNTELLAELAALRQQNAELIEGMKAQATTINTGPAPQTETVLNFASWSDDDLKDYIKTEGGDVPKNAKREALEAAAAEIHTLKAQAH